MGLPLRAGIIGLGQIGSRFNDDPKRKDVWTHAGAYAQVPEVSLVAGADLDRSARRAFETRWGVTHLYHDFRQMLEAERLDLVSICSPTPCHAEAVLAAVESGARAVFCEKPLADNLSGARLIVDCCEKRGVVLAVNYTRRWDRNYLWPLSLVRDGFLGRLLRLSGVYSGAVFNVGTHVIDAMLMYASEVEWVTGEWGDDLTAQDPSVTGFLGFKSGAMGTLTVLPERTDLVMEIDLLGTEGRARILENGRRVEIFRFNESQHYSGYRELAALDIQNPLPVADRFVQAVRDIVRCVQEGGQPACSGRDGLATLEVATALCQSARAGGVKQILLAYTP